MDADEEDEFHDSWSEPMADDEKFFSDNSDDDDQEEDDDDDDDEAFHDADSGATLEQPPMPPPPINSTQTPSKQLLSTATTTTTTSLRPALVNTPSNANSTGVIYAVQFIKNRQRTTATPNATSASSSSSSSSNNNTRLFMSAEKAKNVCKEDPVNRRFKPFRNFNDAYAFSYEASEIESGQVPSISQLKARFAIMDDSNPPAAPSSSSSSNGSAPAASSVSAGVQEAAAPKSRDAANDAEKLPFSAPKKFEINALRALIESNNLNKFYERVTSNPRFLITAGDAPVCVQVSTFIHL